MTSPTRAMCPAHLIRLPLITYVEENKLWSSSLRCFLHPPVTYSFLGPNVLLGTLFSGALNVCSSVTITDHVSHPYKVRTKLQFYIVVIIHLFKIRYFLILIAASHKPTFYVKHSELWYVLQVMAWIQIWLHRPSLHTNSFLLPKLKR